MSFLQASAWILGAHLSFLWLVLLTISLRESAMRDPFSHVICQTAAYLLALFIILRLHAPNTAIRQFAALRWAHPGICGLAVLLGACVSIPATWVFARLEERLSAPESRDQFIELFFEASQSQQILLGIAIALIGPVVEELLFRGAIFGPLIKRGYSPALVIVFTAGTFALVHQDFSRMAPIFLVGLLLGYLRYASQSLLPPVLLHAAFNTVPLVALFSAEGPPKAGDVPDEPAALSVLLATIVVGVLLVAVRHLAKRQT